MNRQSRPSDSLSDVWRVQAMTATVEAASQVASSEDSSLIASLRRGDEDALMTLLQRYHSSMIRLALIHLPGRAEAELVVRETWMAILRNLAQLQGHNSLKIEIHRLLLNSARARRQGRGDGLPTIRRSEDVQASGADPQRFFQPGHPSTGSWTVPPRRWQLSSNPRLSPELRALIEQALERLPPDQREAITLRDIEGWPSGEVCTLLGFSENHLRALLHCARTFVRQVLAEYFDQMPTVYNKS